MVDLETLASLSDSRDAGLREDDQGAAARSEGEFTDHLLKNVRRETESDQQAARLPEDPLRPVLLPRPDHRAEEVRAPGLEHAVRLQRDRFGHLYSTVGTLCEPVRRYSVHGALHAHVRRKLRRPHQ